MIRNGKNCQIENSNNKCLRQDPSFQTKANKGLNERERGTAPNISRDIHSCRSVFSRRRVHTCYFTQKSILSHSSPSTLPQPKEHFNIISHKYTIVKLKRKYNYSDRKKSVFEFTVDILG